jgi:hypothetical protein
MMRSVKKIARAVGLPLGLDRRRLWLLAIALAGLLALAAPGVAAAHLTLLRPSPSDAVTFHGHGGYSTDGGYPGSVVRAEVPAGSTVEQAYLYGTYLGGVPLGSSARTIDFDGTDVETVEIESDGGILPSTRADVTAQVAAKVGSGGGITSFGIENDPSSEGASFQGAALVVIYSNPASPLLSIAVLDGAASSAGDTATLYFGAALDPATPGFSATMAIGDGFSFQNPGHTHDCGPEPQDSVIEIDEERLTSCAGGSDDGSANNQYLITVGGIGDSIEDPANPNTTTEGTEDELYDLRPFLHNGDTQMSINTANPSGDDDLFLAVIAITANASVGVGNEPPPPPPAEPPAATQAPSVSSPGGVAAGSALVGQPGSFSGAESYTYQWQLCTSAEANSCTEIAGANSVEYTPVSGEVGQYLRFVVTATNATGSTFGRSAIVGPIVAASVSLLLTTTEPSTQAVPTITTRGVPACRSQRAETITWQTARGVHLKAIVISVNGKLLRRLGGDVRQTTVSLVGRGKGSVRVKVTGIAKTGPYYTATRSYRPCIPGSGPRVLRSRKLSSSRHRAHQPS